jgi:hypothetical protein
MPVHHKHQEQVPRKQGLKLVLASQGGIDGTSHQEHVPRKQGLKPSLPATLIIVSPNIKSKFHENKD